MSTMQAFYTTAPESGTITLPKELCGKPLKIVVETETVPVKRYTTRESAAKYSGISKDYDVDSLDNKHTTGILSIAGILKDCPNEDFRDERYEYLMEKYANVKDTD